MATGTGYFSAADAQREKHRTSHLRTPGDISKVIMSAVARLLIDKDNPIQTETDTSVQPSYVMGRSLAIAQDIKTILSGSHLEPTIDAAIIPALVRQNLDRKVLKQLDSDKHAGKLEQCSEAIAKAVNGQALGVQP